MQKRFLLQILLFAQHVSGTTMPIIRSSSILYSGCCLWYFALWFARTLAGLPASILKTGHITLGSTPDQKLENHSTKYHRKQPLYNTLELLMMGIVVPETCWASNKICNKNLCFEPCLIYLSGSPVKKPYPKVAFMESLAERWPVPRVQCAHRRQCPVFASYTLAFALQLRIKPGKTSVRVAEECQLAGWKQNIQSRTYYKS